MLKSHQEIGRAFSNVHEEVKKLRGGDEDRGAEMQKLIRTGAAKEHKKKTSVHLTKSLVFPGRKKKGGEGGG